MANPVFFDIPEDEWTKVATSVVTGMVHKVESTPDSYQQTYRLTGEDAPTAESDGVVLFDGMQSEPISSSDSIDVYIWAKGAAGRVRVDL